MTQNGVTYTQTHTRTQPFIVKDVSISINNYKNHDIAIAMSSSRAVPVLGLNILQG